MSLDELAETALYEAVNNIAKIPRPKERERILLNAIDRCGEMMGCKIYFTRSEK